MSCRTDCGIPDLKNGEHRLLQKQIDLMHEDVLEIKESVQTIVPLCSKNETRSKINTKIMFVIMAALVTLGAAMIAL